MGLTTTATRATVPPGRPGPAGLLPLSLLALAGCALVPGGRGEFRSEDAPPDTASPAAVARATIDTRDIRAHIAALASDRMRGRDTPSSELERAAALIAERFAAAGLEPAGDDGGYIHFWPFDTLSGRAAAADDGAHAVPVPNVVAVLAGSDAARAGEYVLLTANFDHLGVGDADEDGDSIRNGADDNASGTAALMELAEAFGALPARPARPVLFLATSGEEQGLLGARAFAERPTVFLSEAVAVINLDMVGRNSPDSVGLVGHAYSSLGPLVVRTAAAHAHLRLTVDTDPAPGRELFHRSDHYPFARAGIPAVALTGGLHEDYHRASDEPDRVDPDKAARVARLAFLVAYALAAGEDAEWTEDGIRAVRR